MHFYGLSFYPENEGRKQIAWFANDKFSNDFQTYNSKQLIRELNFSRNNNNEFSANFLTSNSILIRSNLINISKNVDINGNSKNTINNEKKSNWENIDDWIINFQPEVYRFSPTLKSTFLRSSEQKKGNNNLLDTINMVNNEFIYQENDNLTEEEFNKYKKEYIKNLSRNPEQTNESGWYDYVWDFREPYIHSNLHMGENIPKNYQYFNIYNWVIDKTKKYDISLNYQFKFVQNLKQINTRPYYDASNGKYTFQYVPFLERFVGNKLTKYDVKFFNNDWIEANNNSMNFHSFGFSSTNSSLNKNTNLKIRRPVIGDKDYNENYEENYYQYDEKYAFMNYDSKPNFTINNNGYTKVQFNKVFYVPKNYILTDDKEHMGEVYLIIQNDLNDDGEYTPIYDQNGNEVDITNNESISKTTNFSSIDGETKIFTVISGTNDDRMSPFHWGRKLDSDQIYSNYVTGWEPINYFYDFNSFKPIEIVGIFLTSVLIIGTSYLSIFYANKYFKKITNQVHGLTS